MANPDRREIRCLVTGASSGIGRAIAEELARAGARLILTGRCLDRLHDVVAGLLQEGVEAPGVTLVTADLTREADRERLFAITRETFDGALDLVVNSAGVGAYGRFESHDPSILQRIMEINVFALAEVCRAALPMLRQGRSPAVINLGSIVARRSLPGRSEYSASKHAVAALTDALRAEWHRDGIHVMLVNPGFTLTPFEQNVLIDTAFYKTAGRRSMSPEVVARATLKALARRRRELTLTDSGRWLIRVDRWFPWLVDRGLASWTARLYTRYANPVEPDRAAACSSRSPGCSSTVGTLE